MSGRERKIHIASVAAACPPYRATQEHADAFFMEHYAGRLRPRSLGLMRTILAHPSIRVRNFAFEDPACLVDEDPDSRIARFTRWSVELSARAVTDALSQVGLSPNDISVLVVNTCTGYVCPGISTYLIERMDLPRTTRAFDLVGSGCGGALPNLDAAGSLLGEDDAGVAVSVSAEICSATFQMEDTLSLITSNAIFADGAAAAVLWPRPEGLANIASSCYFAPEHRDDIRYVHKNGQLHNQLSGVLPLAVGKAAARVVAELLGPLSLRVEEIPHWAIHPGGEKIVNVLRKELGLTETQLAPTRAVLAEYGNMSSPTVWFVLRDILTAGIEKGSWCVMLAFGAGLSAHACLLRKE